MKKYIIVLVLFCTASQISAKAAEQLEKFITMEIGHKNDWFNLMAEEAKEKADLLKQQHTEWANFKTANIKKLAASKAANLETFFKDELKAAVELHEKQVTQWREFEKKRSEKAKQIDKKHSTELAAFKKQVAL